MNLLNSSKYWKKVSCARFVSSRSEFIGQYQLDNKDRKVAYDQQYNRLHKDRKKDYSRQYNLQNRDEISEAKRQYRLKNKDLIFGLSREYILENKDSLRLSHQQYYSQNADKIRASKRQYRLDHHANPETFTPRSLDKSWKTPELVRAYFESIAQLLNISDHNDWYRVSSTQLRSLKGGTLLSKFGNLGGALIYAYPHIEWDLSKFSLLGKKSEQRRAKAKIEALLPGIEIIENYQHPELNWDKSDRPVELDLWIPKYSIGVEYQGEHHYFNLDSAFGPNGTASLYSERDIAKHSLCKTKGITWDGRTDSLASTLYQARPDVFPVSDSSPIPDEMPEGTLAAKRESKLRNKSKKSPPSNFDVNSIRVELE